MRSNAVVFVLFALPSLAPLTRAQAAPQDGGTPVEVSAQCNPFLAGQPDGTPCKKDTAPAQSPLLVPLQGSAPSYVRVTDASGLANYWPKPLQYGPEGGFLQSCTPDLGISGYTMPICALLGVFLPDHTNSGAAPPTLDFSSAASRDYLVFAPLLYQPFFIGDGLRDDGVTVQSILVPPGATRLFLGICDGGEWNNNVGGFQCTVEQVAGPCSVSTYCTPKTNSKGCVPRIGFIGSLSLTGADDFFVTADEVLNCRPGLLLWSLVPEATPFMGGLLCVAPPVSRTALQDSGGHSGVEDCSGHYSFHMSQAFLAANGLLVGETIYAQYWARDPMSLPWPVSLTDALSVSICP